MDQSAASLAAGMSRGWLHGWLKDDKNTDPGAAVLTMLADVLQTDINSLFLDYEALPKSDDTFLGATTALSSAKKIIQATNADHEDAVDLLNRRATMDVLQLWLESNGVIDGRFDQLRDHFDILSLREHSQVPEVVHVGRIGLAATALEDPKPEALEKFLTEIDQPSLNEIDQSMRSVIATGRGNISRMHRTVRIGDDPVKDLRFARAHLSAHVITHSGKTRPVIVNIAHLVDRMYRDPQT